MPGLDYPYHFQCKKCGVRTVVERSDATDLQDDPTSSKALSKVLKHRGWEQGFNGVLCPDCAGEKD